MENLSLDDALLKLGFGKECLVQHERFHRTDTPPTNVVFQSSHIVEPKNEPNNQSNEDALFPFKLDNITFTKNEFFQLQKTNLEHLLSFYQKRLDQLDIITNENKIALNKADMPAKRKHFYYCYLISLLNTPFNIGFNKLEQLIALRKLFLNQQYKSKLKIRYIEKCCKEPYCPQPAIYGSSYCGWHITKDPNQRLYVKCPVCGWPCIKNKFFPCPSHRGKPRPQRSIYQVDT